MSEEIEKRILEELRSLNALQRKTNKACAVAMIILAVFTAIFFATIPLWYRPCQHARSPSQAIDSWRKARTLFDDGETMAAKEMTERLLRKYPDYYYGHVLMGSVHQAMGDLVAAERSYARAAALLPTQENEKTLAAIRKAIETMKQGTNQPVEDAR